ncbi:MAG TPA: kelch repeat-containing protein, partial [Burkholderiaceae bacterium]|nr:kelch repeat-containing protein [Burkholderiaceae bacterium]
MSLIKRCKLVAIGLPVLLMAACGSGGDGSGSTEPPPAPQIKTITISPSPISTGVDIERSLMATAVFTDGSQKDVTGAVTWNSADSAIATIAAGKLRGVSIGATQVRASSGSIVGEGTVTVTPTGTWTAVAPIHPGATDEPKVNGGQTLTLLPNGDALLAGGNEGCGGAISAQAFIYRSATNTWSDAPGLACGGHTATLLNNGKVLIAGGRRLSSDTTASTLFDPATNTESFAGNFTGARSWHTATLLFDGNVLVAGGSSDALRYGSSALIFQASTGTWKETGAMITVRYAHTATLLQGGKVLVTGGRATVGGLALA